MLAGLSERARTALLGVFAAALAFFVFGGLHGKGLGPPASPDSAVPPGAFLVATIRLGELRRSPVYEVLFGGANAPKDAQPPVLGAKALGIERFRGACGFDPLSRVSDLAIAVPEEGDKGDLGLAARVDVTSDELTQCAAALGQKRESVDTKEVHGFTVVEDTREGAGSAPARVGYGYGGLLVAGRGTWFDAMVASVDHPRAADPSSPHTALREALTRADGGESWRAPTAVVTAVLPRALRDRIKNEMGAEVGAKEASQVLMAGVLSVSQVGLALKIGKAGENVEAAAELVCDSDDACGAVEKLILKKKLDWSKELILRVVGIGPLIDSIEVKRGTSKMRVTAKMPADPLAKALERVVRFAAGPR